LVCSQRLNKYRVCIFTTKISGSPYWHRFSCWEYSLLVKDDIYFIILGVQWCFKLLFVFEGYWTFAISEYSQYENPCQYGDPEFCLPSLLGSESSIINISLGSLDCAIGLLVRIGWWRREHGILVWWAFRALKGMNPKPYFHECIAISGRNWRGH